MKPKVFITRKIPGKGIKLLQKYCQVRIYLKDKIIPRKELLKGIKWCDALLCLLTDKIDKKLINANLNLKVISNYAIGFNNIDVNYATKRGIPVTNTPSMLVVNAVAEHTLALMLTLAKRINEADQFTKKGKYKGWNPTLLVGTELIGKTLGIVGLGRIGMAVAERTAPGLGMKILYYDVRKNQQFERKYNAEKVTLTQLLKRSDFVTLHVPLLPSTKYFISKKELALMKKSAFLINTSRGSVINEKDLIQALKKKEIRGAGLDVFEHERKISKSLMKSDHVILTPHIASATIEARENMALDAANNILAVLKGKKAPKTVNPEVYQRKNNKNK